MKYIVITTPIEDMGFKFPNFINHIDFSEHMHHLLVMECNLEPSRLKTVSAGFIDSDGECYGKSESLGLESVSTDSFLLR